MGDRDRADADADPAAADAPADAPADAGASAGAEPGASADADATAVAPADAGATALAGADDPLAVLALATFHTALLVAALVAGLYLAGPLGELLDGLQTSLGLGLYLALWATTWWTNRRCLGVVADPETEVSASIFVGTGGKWGGVNGVAFFWALFAVTFLPLAVLEGDVVPALFVWAVGSLLALGIGTIVGALFATLDLALFRVADRLGPGPAVDREDSSETS